MTTNPESLRYQPDWNQPLGKTTKKEDKVHIHPHDLIIYVQRKEGLDKACALARKLLAQKFSKKLEALKK